MAQTITFNVLADARKFNQGMDSVNRRVSGLEQFGQRVSSRLGGVLKTGVKMLGGLGAAFLGNALVKGGQRLIGIDNAQAKLRGLGHDAATVDRIMENALASVKGTAFGLDEAATTAAMAVAAGIEPGKELEKYLTLVADAATIAGTDMAEMGSIMGKVQANGRAMTENLNQLQDRGIPVLSWLAEEFGVTTEEMSKMVSQGKVDAETFNRVLERNLGGAALESGSTFQGALKNMQAAMGRFGAMLLGPFMGDVTSGFGGLTDTIDRWAEIVQPHVERFAEWLKTEGIPWLRQFASEVGERLVPFLQAMGNFLVGTVIPALVSFGRFLVDNSFWVGMIASIIGGLTAGLVVYTKVMQAVRAVQLAVNIVMAANPFVLVAIALAGLVAGIIYAYQNSETFRRIVDNAFRVVAGAARTLIDWVKRIPEFFRDMQRRAVSAMSTVRSMVTGAVSAMWSAISGFGRNIVSSIRSAFNSFTANISAGVRHAVEWIRWFPGEAIYQLALFGQRIWNAGWDLIMGLVRGITAAVGRAVEAVKSVGSAVLRGIKSVFGIRSPSREFQSVGFDLVRGLIVGMSKVAGVRKAASGLAREVSEGFGVPELRMAAVGVPGGSRDAVGARTYNVTVNVAPGGSPVETGRQIVRAIEAFERANGGRG